MSKIDQARPIEKGWLDSIVDRCKYSRKDVQAFIKKYQIPQTPGIGNPKRIHIVSIDFTGKKRGHYTDDFHFRFDRLEPGIWGLFSDGNGKGKSTALEVMKWLFRGKASDGLQSGVKSWIKTAELQFCIDNCTYVTTIHQDDEVFSGEIKRAINGKQLQPFKEFNSEEEMAEVVSDFMLEQLELGQVSAYRAGQNELDIGKEVIHGWPALASAMFIGTSYGAIFGDVTLGGLPNRILNMYMGLPWIPTNAALKALDGQLKGSAAVEEQYFDRAQQNRKKRLDEIRTSLALKEQAFNELPAPKMSMNHYNKLVEQYNQTYQQVNASYRRWIDTQASFSETEKSYKADQINLQNFKEHRAANKIFKQLSPTCCPHCEQKITVQQLEKERTEHTCAICDRTMLDGDDSEELLAELQEKAKATAEAYDELKKMIHVRRKAYDEMSTLLGEQKVAMEEYGADLKAEQQKELMYRTLQNEIATLKILETEYSRNVSSEPEQAEPSTNVKPDEGQKNIDETKILAAAMKETESRFKGLQEDLLQDVNKKMLEYCAGVGLGQYNNLNLTSQPALKIFKDGSETSFSKVSKGEQLRLKVLSTIALISVAEERKLGRHPGFIIIDSPAAHEVNAEDLNNLISGLKDLSKVLPSLQIIIASVANETLLSHVDEEHRKYAKGNEFLW